MSIQASYMCSPAFSQVISAAAVDVLGDTDAARLVKNPGHVVEIQALVASLKQGFGSTGSKGVAQRMG
ncbi:MAG: hypothetical protein AAGU05_11725, partial [Anaerolineaceae bacterium]